MPPPRKRKSKEELNDGCSRITKHHPPRKHVIHEEVLHECECGFDMERHIVSCVETHDQERTAYETEQLKDTASDIRDVKKIYPVLRIKKNFIPGKVMTSGVVTEWPEYDIVLPIPMASHDYTPRQIFLPNINPQIWAPYQSSALPIGGVNDYNLCAGMNVWKIKSIENIHDICPREMGMGYTDTVMLFQKNAFKPFTYNEPKKKGCTLPDLMKDEITHILSKAPKGKGFITGEIENLHGTQDVFTGYHWNAARTSLWMPPQAFDTSNPNVIFAKQTVVPGNWASKDRSSTSTDMFNVAPVQESRDLHVDIRYPLDNVDAPGSNFLTQCENAFWGLFSGPCYAYPGTQANETGSKRYIRLRVQPVHFSCSETKNLIQKAMEVQYLQQFHRSALPYPAPTTPVSETPTPENFHHYFHEKPVMQF